MTFMLTLLFAIVFAIPALYVYIEIGRFVGPIVGLILIASLLTSTYAICKRALSHVESSIGKVRHAESSKRKLSGLILISLSFSILITSAFSLALVSAADQIDKKIALFVSQNKNDSLQSYEANLVVFLNENLNCSYKSPEILYKFAELSVYYSFVGSWIMKASGVNLSDLILFEGWGACGEAAIVLQQVMHDSGYETRLAQFKDHDHEWAEVENGSQWLIVDPWDNREFSSYSNVGK